MPEFPQTILDSTANKISFIAAPGSGKTTRVLIPKAQRILCDANIDAEEVLLLTFSRLSALDLRRHAKTLDRVPRASTVHSFCLGFLLSENNHEVRKRVDSILLDFEKESLLSDLKLIFSSTHKRNLRKELNNFSAAWAINPHDETFEENEAQRAFKFAVMNWLNEYQAVLMEEIVYFAVDLARKLDPPEYLAKPKYILVDEYQDLNRLEQEFVDILAANAHFLLVVGDPDQSVYGFKHTHPDGIKEFCKRSGVEPYNHLITGRCAKSIVRIANALLKQAKPNREECLVCKDGAIEGEVHFVRKNTQEMEFGFVLRSVAERLRNGTLPNRIIVLAPKQELGSQFVAYAEDRKDLHDISADVDFVVALRPQFTEDEQQHILQFSLLIKPGSAAHIRSYIGIGDETNFAKEVAQLKEKYTTLMGALENAELGDWPKQNSRVRIACQRLISFKEFLTSFQNADSATTILDELFPRDSHFSALRKLFDGLLEPEDSPKILFDKFEDYIRRVPAKDTSIRVMTLMASKGLEADHVYIVGCNAGTIPGQNHSPHMTDQEYRDEQRRLLYVGVTRAKESLTVSWARHIPFRQAKKQYTRSVGTSRFGKKTLVAKVGLCDFLEDLPDIQCET